MRDRLKYGIVFALLSVSIATVAAMSTSLLSLIAWSGFAFSFALVSIAYFAHYPGLFGKRSDGFLPWWSYIVFSFYYILNHVSLGIYRIQKKEDPYHEIEPGLFLGCRLRPSDKASIEKLSINCVLDLTSEFSEVPFLRGVTSYQNIPLLDATSPTLEELRLGVRFLKDSFGLGISCIYIHCAAGHGRSATYLLAWLLHQNPALSLETALRNVTSIRSGVKLTDEQRQVLEEFAITRLYL